MLKERFFMKILVVVFPHRCLRVNILNREGMAEQRADTWNLSK